MPRTKATTPEQVPSKEGPEQPQTDTPVLDLSDAAVKKLICNAKKRGSVTHDQINSVLPSEEVNSEQIEDVLAMFSEMGINVVETEEAEQDEESKEEAEEEPEAEGELVEVARAVPAKTEANYSWLRDVKNRLAVVDGTEAQVEGFGASSGRASPTF